MSSRPRPTAPRSCGVGSSRLASNERSTAVGTVFYWCWRRRRKSPLGGRRIDPRPAVRRTDRRRLPRHRAHPDAVVRTMGEFRSEGWRTVSCSASSDSGVLVCLDLQQYLPPKPQLNQTALLFHYLWKFVWLALRYQGTLHTVAVLVAPNLPARGSRPPRHPRGDRCGGEILSSHSRTPNLCQSRRATAHPFHHCVTSSPRRPIMQAGRAVTAHVQPDYSAFSAEITSGRVTSWLLLKPSDFTL